MTRPLILITAGRQLLPAGRSEMQSTTSGVNLNYVHSLARAGGSPIIFPCIDDQEAIAAAVEAADGLVLTGGGDVISQTYGEEPHPRSTYQDPVRDRMELEVTRLALERKMPILGICRGIQLLNVALGGTLIQDVPSQVPDAVLHFSHGLDPVLLHTVEIEEGSLMARLMDVASMSVNSYHHQAVKDLGQGLRINCRARDGVIEGVESSEGKPVLAVQFHPEECTENYPQFRKFFEWVVQEASAFARHRD